MTNLITSTISAIFVAFIGCTYMLFSDLNVLEAKTKYIESNILKIEKRLERIEKKIDRIIENVRS